LAIHRFRTLSGARAAFALGIAVVGASVPASAAAAPKSALSAQATAGINDFYRARGGAPLWLAPTSGNAAQSLLQVLSTAQVDGLNPNRYNIRGLSRALRDASGRDPRAVNRAEMLFSQAFVAFARDTKREPNVGIIYVDPELKPTPPSARALLTEAASARSLANYVEQTGWMSPTYSKLRQALVGRMYRSERERRLLALNLQRARALPSGGSRYVVVNSVAQRLYMYENGQVVDSMRVVAGKPSQATPMMSALIRFAVLNPYWNSPHDITATKLAPNVLKQGPSYLKAKGYQVMSDWTDNARVVNPSTVDWKAVVAGRTPIRLRQLPGPANSMGRMKFMFPNEQGIWLHDTPQKDKIEESERLVSAGCVRLEDAPRFAKWLFGRTLKPQGNQPEQKVALATPVPLYITYLTAVPSGSSVTYFDDMYGFDARLASRV
jgi:murein L,D-transpeptidase YcbB/YkuD